MAVQQPLSAWFSRCGSFLLLNVGVGSKEVGAPKTKHKAWKNGGGVPRYANHQGSSMHLLHLCQKAAKNMLDCSKHCRRSEALSPSRKHEKIGLHWKV
jgi:hypothetical protein